MKPVTFEVYDQKTQEHNKYMKVDNTLYKCYYQNGVPVWMNPKRVEIEKKIPVIINEFKLED